MLSANSMVLLDNLSRLKVLYFYLFVAMQAIRFKAINLLKQAVLFDDNGVSTSKIGSLLIPNIIELCKHTDL